MNSHTKRIVAGSLALLLLNGCANSVPAPSVPQASTIAQASTVASIAPSAISSPAASAAPSASASASASAPTASTPAASTASNSGRVSSAGRIAYVGDQDGNQDIYVLTVDGASNARLTTDAAPDVNPSWSPDGTRIVFMSARDGDPEIYVMDTDGNNQQRLTTDAGIDTSPAWSPDGSQIAYVSDRDGNTDIWVMNADGSQPRKLTQHPERDFDPAWSPDGTRIAFTSYRDTPTDRPAANDLYVMQADGSQVTRLTNDFARNGGPVWSPDGARIAFDYFDGEGIVDGDIAGGDIYVINADGTSQQRLTADATGGRNPSWSADGTHISFASARNDVSTFDLWTMNADGTEATMLTTTPANENEPAYAPAPQAASIGAGAEANFNGVRFRYDSAVVGQATGRQVPPSDYYADKLPAHTEFTFNNPASNGDIPGWVRVFPVSDLAALGQEYASTMVALQPMPPFRATRILNVQEQPLNFANGSGKRSVVLYSQDLTALTNANLLYNYQGTTNDGKHFVSIGIPIDALGLPESMQAVLDNTFPGLTYDANNPDAFTAAVNVFNQDATQKLAALDPIAFTPSLTTLDDLVSSLQVQ